MIIYFLEQSIPFDGNDLNDTKIAGTEKTLINIATELAKRDKLVIKVFNETLIKKMINNVEWININNVIKYPEPDVMIAFSDVNIFKNFKAKKKFLWSHSVQNFEKFIRKNQLIPYIKHKPILILEGEYHSNNRPFITSFFGKKIVKLAADYEFINEKIDINSIPDKKCIFTTRSDRNLNLLLNTWKEIYSLNNDASLEVNPPLYLTPELNNQNVKIRNKGNKKDLIKDLISSKLMLIPGHKGEVFCLAAEEARVLCLPIITLGYGSLYERVEHNVTGYIAKNISEFVYYSHKLLNDDNLYKKFRKNLYALRNTRNLSHVAQDLLDIINN